MSTEGSIEVNFLTEEGARELCANIIDYWENKLEGRYGVPVLTVEKIKRANDVWGVRSNMINGMPPQRFVVRDPGATRKKEIAQERSRRLAA